MNDKNKHNVIGQMNHQTADPKANTSIFLFFSNAQNILKFYCHLIPKASGSTFDFANALTPFRPKNLS
jgi:hypothetical protein